MSHYTVCLFDCLRIRAVNQLIRLCREGAIDIYAVVLCPVLLASFVRSSWRVLSGPPGKLCQVLLANRARADGALAREVAPTPRSCSMCPPACALKFRTPNWGTGTDVTMVMGLQVGGCEVKEHSEWAGY